MANIEKLSEELSALTILEAAELVKSLECKWGVKSSDISSAMPAVQDNSNAPKIEEKTEFDVILKTVGDKKIQVIKAVRELTSLGLKEAKSLVDSAPKIVKSKISKKEAEDVKEKLSKYGATVEID